MVEMNKNYCDQLEFPTVCSIREDFIRTGKCRKYTEQHENHITLNCSDI